MAENKTYDGNTSAVISSGVVSGMVDGETLLISGSGSFADKNAADGKTVTVADVTALTKGNGTGLWSNYNLTSTGNKTTTADIGQKAISITINNFSKKLRDPDPTFSFESTGLSSDDIGKFEFTRELGERPGTYRISASNPNFRVTILGDAILEIEAPPAKPAGELANDVSKAVETSMAASFYMTTLAVTPAARVSSAGVKVELVQRPELQTAGLVTVSMPPKAAATGAGLTFALPNELVSAIANAVNVEATLVGGEPLPSWLRFDNTNGQFVIGDVADVSSPLELNVQLGSQAVTVVISERSN